MKYLLFPFLFLLSCQSTMKAQEALKLYNQYEKYQEPSITTQRFKHSDIVPLIEKRRKNPLYKIVKAGQSIEGRDIYMVKMGTGETKVLLWSQMHGNEPTATMAIMDIFNFFDQNDEFNALRKTLLENLTLYFIPMLNPDGAERFQRQNALGVDLNRDALRLQNPEAQVLRQAQNELQPDWGFNLHDQSRYYAAGNSNKPATLSFLAPAYDYEKTVNEKRGDAMKLIVKMNQILQKYIPEQVAKYSDAFEPRAFGDNIQKWGTRTILIESGGHYDDPEKQYIRKLNFMALMGAFEAIAKQTYVNESVKDYNKIPYNNRSLYDLILREVKVEHLGKKYLMDLAFYQDEQGGEDGNAYHEGQLAYIGDLSTSKAYKELEANDYEVVLGKTHPLVFETVLDATQSSFEEFYKEGYTTLKVMKLPPPEYLKDYPIQFIDTDENMNSSISLWSNPSFFLEKNGKREYMIVNGKLYQL